MKRRPPRLSWNRRFQSGARILIEQPRNKATKETFLALFLGCLVVQILSEIPRQNEHPTFLWSARHEATQM
jgi:hypothetical protein